MRGFWGYVEYSILGLLTAAIGIAIEYSTGDFTFAGWLVHR